MAAMPGNARIVTSLLEEFSHCHVEAEMLKFDGWEMEECVDGWCSIYMCKVYLMKYVMSTNVTSLA